MTIDLTVKTLDSNVYQFSVPDEFTVKEFKEFIAQTVSVAWDKQRIIFGGKVLQDDRRLVDCNVAGKTVHLVQRVPPPASRGPVTGSHDEGASRNGTSSQQGAHPELTRVPLERAGNNVYVGAFTLPHVEVAAGGGPGGGTEQLEHMIHQLLSSMMDIGRQTAVVSQGSSPDAEIGGHQEVHSRLLAVRSLLRLAFNGVNVLEGRPPEEYAVQNPPGQGQAETGQRRETATSTSAASGSTASAPSSSTSGAQATAPSEEQQVKTEEAAGDTRTSADNQPESQSQSGQSPSESSRSGQPQAEPDPRRPLSFLLLHELQPTRQTLAHVYDELDYLNERLAPFLNRYRDFLRRETLTPDDVNAEEARRVTHRVAEVTHAISHVQHLLSDLEIDPRHPAHLVVRPSGPVVPGAQISGHHIEHSVPIRAQINVNTVAILSNGNGNLSTGETQPSAGETPADPNSGMTAREAAAHAAAHAGAHATAHAMATAAAQAATAALRDETASGAGGGEQASSQGASGESDRPSRSFSPADFVRRVSNAAFRSVSRSCSNAGTSSTASATGAGGAVAGQTPSREETTASNTTTGTTQTPTTAGATMGGGGGGRPSSSGSSGSASGAGGGGSGSAFTMPTATASHTGSRPAAVVREVFDPFLVCDSIFTSVGRRTDRQWGGRVRWTIPQRSSSVPAATRRRPRDDEIPPGRAGAGAAPPPPPTGPILESLMQSLFPGIGVFHSMPLASFINWEVGNDRVQNEFINDLLATVASTITTSDFMEVILQRNNRSLNGLRAPLREFLNRRLFNGEPYTPQLLETRLSALIDSIAREIPEETREADLHPDIDLVATMSGFLKARTFDLFKFILEADDDPSFGDRLFELTSELVRNTLSLLGMCCRDGPASVERIIIARARQFEPIENDMHLLTAFVTQAGGRRENFGVNESLRPYIVMRPIEEGGDRRAPAESATGDVAATTDGERMDVDPVVQGEIDASLAGHARILNNGVTVDRAQVTLEPAVSHEAALSALRAAVPDAPPSADAEWMGGVAPGWAPIIARDMGSQSAVQRPLSDAYLAGMPSKRRRLMKPTSPSQLSDIPASIQQAIQRAGVRPRTSVDALNADVQRNTVALQDALQSSIRDALARRLTEETVDLDKDRFPHAHRITKPK